MFKVIKKITKKDSKGRSRYYLHVECEVCGYTRVTAKAHYVKHPLCLQCARQPHQGHTSADAAPHPLYASHQSMKVRAKRDDIYIDPDLKSFKTFYIMLEPKYTTGARLSRIDKREGFYITNLEWVSTGENQ